jgi:hypothetical protein
MNWFKNVQWSVVLSILRTLCTVGGTGSTLLIALGYTPLQVNTWLGAATAALSVIAMVGPGIFGAMTHTDAAQVANVSVMSPVQQATALSKVPDDAKVLVAMAVPNVAAVVIKDGAGNGLGKLAADRTQPDVKTETQNVIDVKAGSPPAAPPPKL